MFGGFDGTTCLSQFRQLSLIPRVSKILPQLVRSTNLFSLASTILQQFDSTERGQLDHKGLVALLSQLTKEREEDNPNPNRDEKQSVGAGGNRYADAVNLSGGSSGTRQDRVSDEQIDVFLSMGFEREAVFMAFVTCSERGRDIRNQQHVIDILLEQAASSEETGERERKTTKDSGKGDTPPDQTMLDLTDIDYDLKQPTLEPQRSESDEVSVCQICFESKIEVVFDKCGHVTCSKCTFKSKKCPYCREDCRRKIKLVFV